MFGDSITLPAAVPQHNNRGHGPVMFACFADAVAERIEAPGSIINKARRGAEMRTETYA